MKDYKTIFESIETSLIIEGSKNISIEKIQENLDWFKHLEGKKFSDNDYYQILVNVIFYSGFRAATVTAKIPVIRAYFPDYLTVAKYTEDKFNQILSDSNMIRNRAKIKACIKNAYVFRDLVQKHGSIQNYIEIFSPRTSFENMMRLKDEIENRFYRLGKITVYHFLTDIGLPVLKPDRVICRIFERLGLIENKDNTFEAILQGRKFADATGLPIRYIDIIFVTYGQVQSREFGIERGICLEEKPSCNLCNAKSFCN
jgi:DNA-3-methyladenine glycosylase I